MRHDRADCRGCAAGRVVSRARDARWDGGWAGVQCKAVGSGAEQIAWMQCSSAVLLHPHLRACSGSNPRLATDFYGASHHQPAALKSEAADSAFDQK